MLRLIDGGLIAALRRVMNLRQEEADLY